MKKHLFNLMHQEKERQEATINLIASENYASQDVLDATGSVLTNKYAEGYPTKRYYSGCTVLDEIELETINLAKKLFSAEHVNVQPHSGSQANMAAYLSALNTGDTVLGMSLGAGGHLTHGHKVNFSGMLFNFVPYHVSPENELLDYDEIELLVNQHKPKMIIAGASAYSRTIDFSQFARIAEDHGAILFVDMAHLAGLVAAGLHPNPVNVADIVTSTTHKTLRGPRGGLICCRAERANTVDRAVMPGSQGGPLMHAIAAKAIAFQEALDPSFNQYQKQVIANARAMVKTFKNNGYHIVSDGTDNHLFLVNLHKTTQSSASPLAGQSITGNRVETTLEKVNITVNRNCVPFDTQSPSVTSGFRIGTSAITTRGCKENDAMHIAQWIHEAIMRRKDEVFLARLGKKIRTFCKKFPIYTS